MHIVDLSKFNLQGSNTPIKLYAGAYGTNTLSKRIWHPLTVTAYSVQEAIGIALKISKDKYQGPTYFDHFADMVEVPFNFIEQVYKANT